MKRIRERLTTIKLTAWHKRLAMLCIAILFFIILFSRPQLFDRPTSYVVEDAGNNLLSASIAEDGQWRFPQSRQIPARFIDCLLTYEDRRFFEHPGVDAKALVRATYANFRGSRRQGGSTISMQTIRLAYKNKSRTLTTKICETIHALLLEIRYSKKEILSMYASNAPFGGNVVGLDAAAWRYFGRAAEKLSWAEMATLAVLPNAPSLIHPGKNTTLLLAKRDMLLKNLVVRGKITDNEASLAMLEPLPGSPQPLPQLAPHLLQLFKKQHKGKNSPTIITSTLNRELQKDVTAILNQHHGLLSGNGINNSCALVLDVESGHTLAYVGNVYDPSNTGIESDVDVIQAPRSPGSVLKPVLYAAMLSDGLLLPNTLVPDIPTQISGYAPQNFDLAYDGAVPAHRAIARSLNVPAVRLLQQYKYARFYEVLQRYGINTLKKPADHYGLSLILGGCEVSMWDVAGMYASMARILNHQEASQGICSPSDIHPPAYTNVQQGHRTARDQNFLLDATSIYHSFQAMEEVMRPGEEGLWQHFTSAKRVAWKTGTSFGFRDGWAIGITPTNVVAVWVGNADGEGRAGLVGISTAAPIMFDIFRLLPGDAENATNNWFREPAYNYSFVPVCRKTGFRANFDCDQVDTVKMPPLAGRSPLCPYHSLINLDASGAFRVNDQCASPAAMRTVSWFVLPPTMEFYYKQRNHDYAVVPPMMAGCNEGSSARVIELIYPERDMKIYVPLEVSGQKGRTVFSATHKNATAKIFWSIDDQFIGTTETFHQLAASPPTGRHTLTVTDNAGNTVSRKFEIIGK